MKWLYLIAGTALFIKMVLLSNPTADLSDLAIVDAIVKEAGVPNAVSGIIFRNRLYDTLFEVVVFSISIMGVRFLLANEQSTESIRTFTDAPSVVIAQLGATIAALVGIELAIRGHLSPGGGFAAGVAGGTAIGLVAITTSLPLMERAYKRWRAALVEKVSVLIFLAIAALALIGLELPQSELGALLSGGWIPLLNILVALKVALGAWASLLLFIRYRGLL
ncbi:MAG: Na(+)/H(+) antiporter subunit B [Phormidesmis sp.]